MATIDVGLAYRDDSVSEWTEMAHSSEQRKLNCKFTIPKVWKFIHFVFLNAAYLIRHSHQCGRSCHMSYIL